MFYIDSIGHSGSGWLSNSLNNHDQLNDYMDEIFKNKEHFNIHRSKNRDLDSKEIFLNWPKSFLRLF